MKGKFVKCLSQKLTFYWEVQFKGSKRWEGEVRKREGNKYKEMSF